MDFASSTFQKAARAIRLSRRHKCRDSFIISICNHDRAVTCEEIVECESHDIGFVQTFGYTLDITRDQVARHREAESTAGRAVADNPLESEFCSFVRHITFSSVGGTSNTCAQRSFARRHSWSAISRIRDCSPSVIWDRSLPAAALFRSWRRESNARRLR